MKNKYSTLLLTLIIVGLIGIFPCSAVASATVSGDSIEAAAGAIVEYRVSISGNPGLTGIGLRLSFDTSVFSLVYNDEKIDCAQGDFSPNGMLVCGANDGGCRIVWTHTSDVASDGTLFVLKLKVNESATPGDYPIKIQNIASYTVNKAEETVSLSCNGGTVAVRAFQPLLYGEAVTVKQGESFDYAVLVQDNPGVASCDVIVRFDPNTLTLEPDAASGGYAVKGSDGITQGSLVSKAYVNAVEVFWNHAYGSTSEGTLFVLRFKAKESAQIGEHTVQIECVAENTQNTNEQPVNFLVKNGSVTVESNLAVDALFSNPHTASITIRHAPARYVATAFYNSAGKLIAADVRETDNGETTYSVTAVSENLQEATYKIMFLDVDLFPVCECYTGGLGV